MLLLYALQVTRWQRSLINIVMSILVNYTYHIYFTPILSKCSVYRNHTYSWFYQTVKCDLINIVFKTHDLKTLFFLKNVLFKTVYLKRPLWINVKRLKMLKLFYMFGLHMFINCIHMGCTYTSLLYTAIQCHLSTNFAFAFLISTNTSLLTYIYTYTYIYIYIYMVLLTYTVYIGVSIWLAYRVCIISRVFD